MTTITEKLQSATKFALPEITNGLMGAVTVLKLSSATLSQVSLVYGGITLVSLAAKYIFNKERHTPKTETGFNGLNSFGSLFVGVGVLRFVATPVLVINTPVAVTALAILGTAKFIYDQKNAKKANDISQMDTAPQGGWL